MYRTIKITRYVVLIMMCVVSCSYQSPFIFEFSDIPEQVYLIPQVNDYELSTVGVFRFARPSYASGEMGKVAAEVLYNELLKKKVFLNIVNETELPYVSVEHMVELARHKGYDLIISGDLLYYFDGSELLPSHIEERIQVVDVPSGKTLWYATAVEVGHPTPPIDFFLFTQEGAGASATTVLFRKNAEKFCTMFLEEPAQVKIDKEKDDDSDGLYNYLDKCPDTPEGVAVDDDGCPKDSDHDGVPDYRDKCPGTPEGVAVDVTGCPLDSDQDGVCDYLDKCPGTPEGIVVDDDGCPKDSDHDGVPYDRDKCPCTPEGVAVDDDGCPKDSDRDGVPDYRDKCPSTPEGVAVDAIGCPPDSDQDGVYDYLDECPCTPRGANVSQKGCWIIKGIFFDFNKWDIKPEAYTVLAEIVAILKNQSDLKVEVQGHTDNIGSSAFNKSLSKKRAKAVMKYLIKKGVNRSRLSSQGYGFSRPIASNDTEEGRSQNRRVELRPIR